MLKKAAEISKGSGFAGTENAGFITKEQLDMIAEIKISDLNTRDLEKAMKMIAGTAKSIGIEIKEIKKY